MIIIKDKIGDLDLDAIVKLEKRLFEPNNYEIDEFKKMLSNLNFKLIAIYKRSSFIGYSLIYFFDTQCEIFKIGIKPIYQNQGYGSKLINYLKNAFNKIIIEVSDKDQTNIFYERNGFIITGKRERYYYDGSNALIYEWTN